ncbi:hypothetical protein HanIR_Chr12g0615191 [Helianthus annuus]|nr:hypothetical protein HanIR_Chr12g0615191 [Helianthus annuus]
MSGCVDTTRCWFKTPKTFILRTITNEYARSTSWLKFIFCVVSKVGKNKTTKNTHV